MPYDLRWIDETQTILCVDMTGEITWGDWLITVDKLVVAAAKAPNRIDFIFNASAGMPPGNPLPHMKTTMKKLGGYPNLKLVVLVGNRSVSNFVKSLLNLVIRASGVTWHPTSEFVMTMDEALAMIANDRLKQDVAA